MNLDLGQLTPLLDHVPYPVGKTQLVQFAQQSGANEQIMGVLNLLPDKSFNSSQEVKDALGGLGNLGNLGLDPPSVPNPQSSTGTNSSQSVGPYR